MSGEAHLVADSLSNPMSSTPARFIGAVEDEWQLFSDHEVDYEIGEPIGFGASSIVYSAVYRPADTPAVGVPCALKVLDLDSLPPRSLRLLQRETTLMSLSKHPNVLRVRGSWTTGHKLYIALRLMNKGSAADVMRYGWPGGMEEDVVRCILRQALKGLNYLHINGFIHRDIKAANLLIDDDGTVLLGDLGVAADLAEDSSHINSGTRSHSRFNITSDPGLSHARNSSASSTQSGGSVGKRTVLFDEIPIRPRIGKRKSFVGTPCWMAPELIQGKQYDSKADIWSFGITALELSQGRPPRSRESPQRVLLRTIQDDPPTLDREGGTYKYSRTFKEVVEWCLNKDPAKRPTAEELLQASFFKGAKKKSYLINTILKDLPPLTRRQERRPIPLIKTASSIESWDFATTVHSSPTVWRRPFSNEHGCDETVEGVFTMEEEALLTPDHGPPTEILVQNEDAAAEQAEPGSASPSTSASTFDGSPSVPNTSTPSSYTDASEFTCGTQSATSEVKNNDPLAIAEHGHQPPLPAAPQALARRLSSTSWKLSASPSSYESVGRRNLWQKLKTNVKGSSSATNLSDKQTYNSTSKRGKLNGMFAAGKGLLSGNTGAQT